MTLFLTSWLEAFDPPVFNLWKTSNFALGSESLKIMVKFIFALFIDNFKLVHSHC
jgi:hypothetical protein